MFVIEFIKTTSSLHNLIKTTARVAKSNAAAFYKTENSFQTFGNPNFLGNFLDWLFCIFVVSALELGNNEGVSLHSATNALGT